MSDIPWWQPAAVAYDRASDYFRNFRNGQVSGATAGAVVEATQALERLRAALELDHTEACVVGTRYELARYEAKLAKLKGESQ